MPPRDETLNRRPTVFALDVRSLAAFRVALGGVLLADLATRAVDFAIMYGPEGVAPVDLVWSRLGPGEWSLQLLHASAGWQATLMVAAALCSAMFMVGCCTRLATCGCWLLTTSLHARLPIVLNAGDDLLRILLFWSLFLPLGATWSIDSIRRERSATATTTSAATIAFTCQLALVYWCAGLTKLNSPWLVGAGLEQTLALGHYSTLAGEWLRQFPAALRVLNWCVIGLELAGPALLFIPWRTAGWRAIAVTAFITFHLGIAATLHVGLFAWVGAVAWLAMIPGAIWDKLLKTERAARSGLVGSGAGASPLTPLARRACTAALAIVVLWNGLDVLGSTRAPRAIAAMRPVVNASGLRQSWQLFSEPAKFEAWFVYQGRLKTGESVDLLRGVPLAPGEAFPKRGQEFANHRWRKLHLRVAQEGDAVYRQPLAEAMYRSWNDRHEGDEQAVQLKLVCIRRRADASDPAGGVIQFNLATVGGDPYQGNFADALRELEN